MSFKTADQESLGRLFLHSMPGRFESWSEFSDVCQSDKVKHILCLTSEEEIKEKSPDYFKAIDTETLSAKLNQCAVLDFSTPQDITAYRQCIETVADHLLSGENVLIHCAAGIGRTGTAAACLLIEMKVPAQRAIELVVTAGSKAETQKQLHFISRYAVSRSS